MSTSSIIESGLLKSPTIMFNSSLHFSQFCFLYFGPLLLGEYMLIIVTSLVAQTVKASLYNAGDLGSIPESGRSPGEGKVTHSSILAWRIPWMEKPGRLQSTGSQRVGHD